MLGLALSPSCGSSGSVVIAPAWVLVSGSLSAAMDVDFVNNRAWLSPNVVSIASLLACSRASQKWVKNAAGSLVAFGNNVLPYTDLGLLPEAASTNLFLQSQAMNTTNWTPSNVVSTNDATAAPDGTTTADQLTDSNTGGNAQVYLGRNLTVPSAGTYCISIFAKAGTITRLRITTLSYDTSANGDSYFDLTTGTVSSLSPQHANGRITTYANGWYRCSLSFSPLASDLAGAVRFAFATSNATTVTSNGTLTLNLWQAQFEAGTRPSTIIPTTTATVTRPADVITFANLGWFSGVADSFFADVTAGAVNGGVIWAWDAANDKFLDETTGMHARLSGAVTPETVATDVSYKAAGRMQLDNFAITMASGTLATDTSETAPGTLTASRLGCDLAGANYRNAFIRRLASFKTALGDADLAILADPFQGNIDNFSLRIDNNTYRIDAF